jgi:putative nucleotide binding protein
MSEYRGNQGENRAAGSGSPERFRPLTGGHAEGGLPPRLYEEYAYVLDYLQYGRPATDKPRHLALPTVQVIGETYFTLLEAEVRAGSQTALHERVYIGKDRREKINRIIGRIGYNDLTANAKAELLPVLEKLIANQEQRFVSFFNNSQAITPRMHALELLPGIGKKSMWQIINAREKKPFASFQDIQDRTSISDPIKVIAKRILDELTGGEKYRIFSRAL